MKALTGVERVAGVDEAGRGPWAGPVVAAAVILRRARLCVLIDDSKRLTALQRRRAFDVIRRFGEIGIGIVCAEEIDRMNILRASLEAMRLAIYDLASEPDLVLVDGNLSPRIPFPCRPIVGGDRSNYVVSCASIVAKVTRDRLMTFYHDIFPEYHFDRHKGYGTLLHTRALCLCGPSVLHRMSFQPVHAAGRTARFGGARRHFEIPENRKACC